LEQFETVELVLGDRQGAVRPFDGQAGLFDRSFRPLDGLSGVVKDSSGPFHRVT